MENSLPNHVVNLPDDEQVKPKPVPALLGFTPSVLRIPNNNNWWIEEEPEEDPEMEEEEEEEEEEMDIKEEMDDPEIINPYEIEDGELPPPPADSNISSNSEPEVEAEDLNENEATTVGTITRKDVDILHRKVKSLAQQIFERANTEYSTLKRLGEIDRYLGRISMERRSETQEHHELKQSLSTLEDQMQGLMLEDKEEKERLKKKLRGDMKKMMMEEFYPDEEVQRVEDGLRSLKLRDTNIATYTQRFNELVLLCPEAVPTEKKNVEAYIKGLPENIKGEVTTSRPVNLNETVRMAYTLMEQKIHAKAERIAEGNKMKWENSQGGNKNNNNNNRGNYQDNTRHHQYNNHRQGNVLALTDAPAEQTG
nr:reverse transcriptase domain-containing protein [Tanacetum cinerariifolium]